MSALSTLNDIFGTFAGDRGIGNIDQWLGFVRTLKEDGLLSESEVSELQQLPLPSEQAPVTLTEIHALLHRIYTSERSRIVDDATQHSVGKVAQVEQQLELFHKHPVPLDTDAADRLTTQVNQLISLQRDVLSLFAGFPKAVDEARGDEDVHSLVLNHLQTSDGSVQPNPAVFQQKNAARIEKQLRKVSVKSWSAQWSGELIENLSHGARRFVAKNVETGQDIEVLSVPKQGVPLRIREQLLIRPYAHRQLALADHIPQYLGCDEFTDPAATCFLFQLCEEPKLSEFVSSHGPLNERTALLGFWLSDLIRGLADIQCQSTFPLAEPLTLDNVRVLQDGASLKFDGLVFGAENSRDGEDTLRKSFVNMAAGLLGVQAPATPADASLLPASATLRSILKCCVGAPGAPRLAHLAKHHLFATAESTPLETVAALFHMWKLGHLQAAHE